MNPVVLLVDDDQTVLNVTESMLGVLGWQTIKAASALDALRIVQENDSRIDLLITDVAMPDMDGAELAGAFVHRYPSARIIFMSGLRNPLVGAAGRFPDDTIFLPKPFTFSELEKTLTDSSSRNRA